MDEKQVDAITRWIAGDEMTEQDYAILKTVSREEEREIRDRLASPEDIKRFSTVEPGDRKHPPTMFTEEELKWLERGGELAVPPAPKEPALNVEEDDDEVDEHIAWTAGYIAASVLGPDADFDGPLFFELADVFGVMLSCTALSIRDVLLLKHVTGSEGGYKE